MKKLILASAMGAMLATGSVNAEDAMQVGEMYRECGLGGLIAKGMKNKDNADLVAISTNVTWDLGTTAVISGMSSPDTCARREVKVAAFIFKSYPELEKDLAMGQGEYLDALIKASGATDVDAIRAEFAKVVSDPAYPSMELRQKAEALYGIVMSQV